MKGLDDVNVNMSFLTVARPGGVDVVQEEALVLLPVKVKEIYAPDGGIDVELK